MKYTQGNSKSIAYGLIIISLSMWIGFYLSRVSPENPAQHSKNKENSKLSKELTNPRITSTENPTSNSNIQSAKISGRVVDSNGNPLPAVLLKLTHPNSVHLSRPIQVNQNSLHKNIRHLKKVYEESSAAFQQVQSATDGRFEFFMIPNGPLQVSAHLAGYQFHIDSVTPNAKQIQAGSKLLLVGTPQTRLEIDVRLPNGTQPKSAEIELMIPKSEEELTWTPEANFLWLKPGPFYFRMVKDSVYSSTLQEIKIIEGVETLKIKVKLRSSGAISVSTSVANLPDSKPTYTFVLAASSTQQPDLQLLAEEGRFVENQDKACLITPLAPGWYWVGLGLTRYRVEVATLINVKQGISKCELSLDYIPDDLAIRVFIVDRQSQLVPISKFRDSTARR